MTDVVETVSVDKAQLESEIKSISKDLREFVTKSSEEVKATGTVATETKAAVQKLSEQWAETDKRLVAIEQASHSAGESKARQSLGEQFTNSAEFKAMQSGASRAQLEIKTTLTNATLNSQQPLVPADHRGIEALPFNALNVWTAIPKGRTASNVIVWPRATRTNNAGPQVAGSPEVYTEGATKPESAYSFSLIERPVRTLAHFLPVSTQVMEDSPFLESFLNSDMVMGLADEVQNQCLTGSGAKGNLSGLVTEATAYAPSASPDPGASNNLVRIRSAIRQLEVANFRPSHIVLNPVDWFNLEIERINPGSDDRYIWSNPQDSGDRRLWGVQVLVANAMTAGSFLVGDFGQAMAFEKNGISFQAAYQDASNFRQNLVTLRAECRLAMVVKRTEAFITGALV